MQYPSIVLINTLLLVLINIFPLFSQKNTEIDTASQDFNQLFYEVKEKKEIAAYFEFLNQLSDSVYIARMDSVIANSIQETGMIWDIEPRLKEELLSTLPITMSKIYDTYAASGSWRDLDRFREKYPSYYRQTSFQADIAGANLGNQLFEQDSVKKAEWIAFVQQTAPKQKAIWAVQNRIAKLIDQSQWEQALLFVKEVAPFFQKHENSIRELQQLLEVPLVSAYPKTNLGNGINSDLDEYASILSASSTQLFFCRQINNRERIFFTQKEENNWQEAVEIEELYYGGDRAPLSLSIDGSQLILFENGGIYESSKNKEGWSEPIPLDSLINEAEWQGGATLSGDGKVFIFCSRRIERIGVQQPENTDLYISFKNEQGEWSPPKNLGNSINTNYSERSPFLHPDGKTLYFSTNGRAGLGGLDVYKVTRVGEGWSTWTTPMNLGKHLNTTGDDWGYTVSTDGEYALFSSSHPERGDQDLYRQQLDVKNQPNEISTLAGTLTDSNNQPIEAQIIIEDLDTNEKITEYKSDPTTGEYIIILPDNRIYSYTIKKEGYFLHSGRIDLKTNHQTQQIMENIALKKLEKNVTLPIENLFFESGKAIIQPNSYPALNHLAELIKENKLSIRLEGHTDRKGSKEYNLKLSKDRAEAVKTYLQQLGCTETIDTEGFGFLHPLPSSMQSGDTSKNRRVEIKIISIQ